jgi:hypothetical protein
MSKPTLSWIVRGVSYSLDEVATLCKLLEYDGLGMPPLHRLEVRGPLQNGATDRGFRLDPRTVILGLGIVGSDEDDFFSKRQTLLRIFTPRTTPGSLRWTLGSTRLQIDGHLVGDGLAFGAGGHEYLWQRCAVAIRCANPVWYDPTAVSLSFNLGGGGAVDEVPSPVPSVVGASTLDITKVINYAGTWKTSPRIIIRGPITDPVIIHEQTGNKLDFTGHTIASAEYYEIDTRFNYLTVEDQDGETVNPSDDSDLTEFAILPASEVGGGGANTFSVTGDAVDAATDVEIIYYTRYLGT